MPNPLQLDEDELDALHGLQTGSHDLELDDLVWERLERRGLVVLRCVIRNSGGSLTRIATLTARGRRYPTS